MSTSLEKKRPLVDQKKGNYDGDNDEGDSNGDDFEEDVNTTKSNESKKPKVVTVSASHSSPKKRGGESVFDLGGKKKVSVGHFKGMILVNIREYYQDKVTGEEKPGAKGIALSASQFIQLQSQMKDISDAIDALEST